MPSDAPPPAPADGERRALGRYDLLRKVGKGGMGVVYEARDREGDRRVAIKCMLASDDPKETQRFIREARTASVLSHPNIVAVYEIAEHEGTPYIAMEFVSGQSLARRLRPRDPQGGPIPLRDALRILRDVSRALDYAHDRGIVHRDIKPENVMIDDDGNAKLADFGLAREIEHGATLTSTGSVMGTPCYMSPEQALGKRSAIDRKSDIWAMGVVLYEVATRRLPFNGETPAEILHRIAHDEPAAPRKTDPRIPRDLETIILKCLEYEPERRYATAGALADDIDCHLEGRPVSARRASLQYRTWKRLRKRKALAGAVAAGVAAVGILSAVLLPKLGSAERKAEEAREEASEQKLAAEKEKAEKARTEEALQMLERARPALDRAVRYLYDRDARYETLVARVETAQKLIEEVVQRSPRLPLAHYLLGRAWEIRGETPKAEASWRTAIELDPAFGPAHFQLGRSLLERSYVTSLVLSREEVDAGFEEAERIAGEGAGELDRAMADVSGFDDAVQREVASALLAYAKKDRPAALRIAWAGLARFEGQDGLEDFHWLVAIASPDEEKIRACTRAIAIRPRHWLALFTRGSAHLRRNENGPALSDFTGVIAIRPKFALAYTQRAGARRLKGDADGAIEDCNTALGIDPNCAPAYANRAAAREEKGELEGAIRDCTDAIRLNPRLSEPYVTRSKARMLSGDPAGALADCDAAIRANPQNAGAYSNRAAIRFQSGDVDGAIADCAEAIRLDPLLPEVYYNRGVMRIRKRDRKGALEDFARAIELKPDDPSPYYPRATVRYALGDREGAIADCTRALELAPPNWPEAPAVRALLEKLKAGRK